MKRFDKKMNLSTYVTLALITTILILGISIYFIVTSQVNKVIMQSQDQNIIRDVESIKAEILSFLETRRIVLMDITTFPIMTQTVMQPETNKGNIIDFLDELKVLNEKYKLTLIDFKGNEIHTTTNEPDINYEYTKLIENIYLEKLEYGIKVRNFEMEYYFSILVPVKYNGLTEGILIAEIPVEKLFLDATSQRFNGMYLEGFKDNNLIFTYGNNKNGYVVKEYIKELDIELIITINQDKVIKTKEDLTTKIVIIIIIFLMTILAVLILSSKLYIVKPIEKLRDMINDLTIGEKSIKVMEKQKIRELDDLSIQFIKMATIIQNRESDLEENEKVLKLSNIDLERALKKLEETQGLLIQQEKLASIGKLAAGVAHELNTPMAYIFSNHKLLKDYMKSIFEYIKCLETSKKYIDGDGIKEIMTDIPEMLEETEEGFIRISEIVKNLLNFSRVDIIERDDYDINQGIKSVIGVAKSEYSDIAKIELNLGDVPNIAANGGEINEVLLNIIINAAHAAKESFDSKMKLIQIRTYEIENWVICEIKDNGCGISSTIIDKIFDPFFTTKPPGEGTGLGLNIAYNIVKKHKGELLVESNLRDGSKFIIKLRKK